MAKLNYEHVFSSAGFSGEQFDIAAGPADTGIIDVLLGVGDGALTEDAPHVLTSTGVLGGARTLDLTGLESESAAKGGQALDGRFFYLSVQNTDILTNSITVSGGATINGNGNFVISTEGDYLFHHVSGGVWRCNILPRPSEKLATLARISFTSADWAAGTEDMIKIVQTGAAGAGEVGPHDITASGSYIVQVINEDLTPDEQVDVEIQYASNGDITLRKARKAPDFNGVAIIVGTLD